MFMRKYSHKSANGHLSMLAILPQQMTLFKILRPSNQFPLVSRNYSHVAKWGSTYSLCSRVVAVIIFNWYTLRLL